MIHMYIFMYIKGYGIYGILLNVDGKKSHAELFKSLNTYFIVLIYRSRYYMQNCVLNVLGKKYMNFMTQILFYFYIPMIKYEIYFVRFYDEILWRLIKFR